MSEHPEGRPEPARQIIDEERRQVIAVRAAAEKATKKAAEEKAREKK